MAKDLETRIKIFIDKKKAEQDFKDFTNTIGRSADGLAKGPLSNLANAIGQAGKQSKAMTDRKKELGMAMSQFNEKTEKGRQVLTAFGAHWARARVKLCIMRARYPT